jgi:hypothetical protein
MLETVHEQSSVFYELIGECYLHGMMDGEAIKHQEATGIETQIFELQ